MKVDAFLQYLKKNRRMAENSLAAYGRDIHDFQEFMKSKGVTNILDTTNTDVVAFLFHLREQRRSPSTINRKLASVRSFFNFLIRQGELHSNPTADIKTPKVERKTIEYLTIEEVDKLLETPDDSIKGKRDRAILELLYATGIRVNEIISANIEDVNLRIGFFSCPGESTKARIVPIGRPARAALEEYIYAARNAYLKEDTPKDDQESPEAHLGEPLFLNNRGQRLTRQGLWKILKAYGDKAGIENKITPHILRNSFAVHMVQNGADLKSLKELMGHEDVAAIQIYLSVTKNRIKDVYDKTHPRA